MPSKKFTIDPKTCEGLIVFAEMGPQLRNLEQLLKETIMDHITSAFSIEKDAFYLVGREVEQIKFVTYLLTETDFSDEKIAKVVDVSINFVNKVKQKISSNQ